MEYRCSACGEKVLGDLNRFTEHTDNHIVDLIKHDHPNWVASDGICQKCYDYYQAELKGSVFKDADCALRARKTKSILSGIKNFFYGNKT